MTSSQQALDLIPLVQNCLSDDLLKKCYLQGERHPTTGHCYVASEALFHLLGGREHWLSKTGRDADGGTHWWLVNRHDGVRVDATQEQYTSFGIEPPYSAGRSCTFLTQKPSKRCQIVLARLAEKGVYPLA